MLTEFLFQTTVNLVLAAIPPLLGYFLGRTPAGRIRAGTIVLGVLWLLFLPNTTYLVTQWRHFLFDEPFTYWRSGGQANRPAMFMTAVAGTLYVGYTLLGVLTFTLALRPVERLFRARGLRLFPLAPILFFLVSLGVYIGLMDRLNSWDVVDPRRVLERCVRAVSHPLALLGITAFAVFHWIAYLPVGYALDGYAAAWRRLRASRRPTSTTSAANASDPRTPPAIRE
jgi:uncharacterized membrane protein